MTTETDSETGRARGARDGSAPGADAPLADGWLAADDAPLPPPRPRKRLTPVTGGLLAVLLIAGGFLGGVLVQKQAGDDGGGAAGFPGGGFPGAAAMAGGAASGAAGADGGAAGANAGAAGASGGAGGASTGAAGAGSGAPGASATIGEVVTVKGGTLYVRDASGNTVKVTAQKGATVTRTVDAEPREIRPGEQVVVQGANRDGAVRATSITAGDATAGLSALLAGGGFGGGPTAAGGAARSGAGGDAVDSLFNDNGDR